ncbi:nucleotidyl transferase AbiEii/AbiGii toxin family protein [Paenibacillus pabuli]|uniref:nucleotidyl transferase AbiEii/AbiGii toxin family protein n=1 Tax=Paenibacillus pabuli TaxID=1472 RepID=UPI003241FADF
MASNSTESIKARLRNLSKSMNIPITFLMKTYFIERFLSRISESEYRDYFLIKGGVFMYANYGATGRMTKDIDFTLKTNTYDVDSMLNIITHIMAHPTDDCVTFDLDTMVVRNTQEAKSVSGYAVSVTAYLGGKGAISERLSFDISYGDIVYPNDIYITFDPLLGMAPITLLCYSYETVIAEKFAAAVGFEGDNTRVKDYYDIYKLSTTMDFDGNNLYKAIYMTFEIREMLNQDFTQKQINFEFLDDMVNNRQHNWERLIYEIPSASELKLSDATAQFSRFLYPLWFAFIHNQYFDYQWNHQTQVWE